MRREELYLRDIAAAAEAIAEFVWFHSSDIGSQTTDDGLPPEGFDGMTAQPRTTIGGAPMKPPFRMINTMPARR